jgi:hypothetical protein
MRWRSLVFARRQCSAGIRRPLTQSLQIATDRQGRQDGGATPETVRQYVLALVVSPCRAALKGPTGRYGAD